MSIKQKTDTALPEIIFTGTRDAASNRRVLRLAQDKKLRKLYQGVYTSNLERPLEAIVTRNWADIVSHLLPDGVVSYRSGFDTKPVDGCIYITRGKTSRTLELPGLTVKVIPGAAAVEGDVPYKKLFLAGQSGYLRTWQRVAVSLSGSCRRLCLKPNWIRSFQFVESTDSTSYGIAAGSWQTISTV